MGNSQCAGSTRRLNTCGTLLLTYNPPGGREIWASMTEAERRAEEDEYVRLAEAMRESKAYIAADELDPYWTARTVRVRNGTGRSVMALPSRPRSSSRGIS